MKLFQRLNSLLLNCKVNITSFSNKGSFSLNRLDKKMEKYLGYKNGFFIELGANDGFTQSNTLYYERKYNWKGMLIEPSPNNFLTCKKVRSKNNSIYCNACVGFDYQNKYVDITYSNLMTFSNSLDLDIVDKDIHIENSKKHLKKHEVIFEFGSVAQTLTSLMDKSNAPRVIDFLSLDVEGAETEVLRGVDFEKYSFKYMLVEHRDFNELEQFLGDKGYSFIEKLSYHDYLFKNDKIA